LNHSRKCRRDRTLSFAAALAISLGLCGAAGAGFDFDRDSLTLQPDGSVAFAPEYESWLGILPSFGIGWKL
jgi:hypothetical protein